MILCSHSAGSGSHNTARPRSYRQTGQHGPCGNTRMAQSVRSHTKSPASVTAIATCSTALKINYKNSGKGKATLFRHSGAQMHRHLVFICASLWLKFTLQHERETLRIWIDSNLWIAIFHLNGDQKNCAGLPSFTRLNSYAAFDIHPQQNPDRPISDVS